MLVAPSLHSMRTRYSWSVVSMTERADDGTRPRRCLSYVKGVSLFAGFSVA